MLYNNRDFLVANTMKQTDSNLVQLNIWMIGFGTFSIKLTITRDEGVFESDQVNGLIIGPIVFIP